MRKILLVEDEDILRDTFSIILSTQPYFFDVAENGQVALDLCADNFYDLILLDLMMPQLDGVGFLRAYQPEEDSHTRIIILSNLTSGSELEEAMNLGADRHVLKSSLSPQQLLELIRYELDAS